MSPRFVFGASLHGSFVSPARQTIEVERETTVAMGSDYVEFTAVGDDDAARAWDKVAQVQGTGYSRQVNTPNGLPILSMTVTKEKST